MASVIAVAKFILERTGEVSAMKLQKLVYYSQAWHMVWEDEPLFDEDFQAWANGPVLPALYARHRGQFKVDASVVADAVEVMPENAAKNIEKVLGFYGTKSGFWLSNLTHSERPWLEARGETAIGDRSEAVISKAAMAEYYGSL
ncbi:Panacea domain-containing protein [Stenotrophomonas nematodicola]|uniref:Panacea domain-containing protein n=1 Tax=Stenotrophomonas nematodicola TaxID=2656746 RepID=A0ABW7D0A4_9GAMM